MTTLLQSQDANFEYSGNRDFYAAAPNGLLGLGFPNTSLAHGTWNRADAGSLRAVGSPAIGQGFVSFNGLLEKYFASDIDETLEMSIMLMLRSSDTMADATHRPYFVTSFNGAADADPGRSTAGITLAASDVNTLSLTSARWNGTASSQQGVTIACDFSKWNLVLARVGNLDRELKNLTTGVTAGGATGSWPRDPSNGRFRLGRRLNTPGASTAEGTSDIAAWAIWNRKITDAEDAAQAAQFRLYLSELFGVVEG